jgi:recombination protein RecT
MTNQNGNGNGTTTAVITRKTQMTLGQLLASKKDQIRIALPKHMDSDRLMRVCLTEITKNPQLKEADPLTFVGSVIQAAQLGLEPGSHLGHGYLMPFRNSKLNRLECQFMMGYRGMIELARRSGQVVSISARAVHAGDEFSYEYGLDEKIKHVPADTDDGNAKLTHVYAIAKLKDGAHHFEVMTLKQVDKIRASSKAANFGPWVSHFEEMAKKTVVRRLFKYLPISVELQRAIVLDETAEAGESQGNDSIIRDITSTVADVSPAMDLNSMAETPDAEPDVDMPKPAEAPATPAPVITPVPEAAGSLQDAPKQPEASQAPAKAAAPKAKEPAPQGSMFPKQDVRGNPHTVK